MKIALIRREFAATGGAELYLQRLASALVDHGHEVHLFASSWSGQAPGVVWRKVRNGGTRSTRAMEFALAVRMQLEEEPWDCVLSLERTLRQDVYRAGDGVHRVWLERRRQFGGWWRWFDRWSSFHRNLLRLEAWTLNPAHTGRVIVNSEMVRREVVERFAFPGERVHVVRNGVVVQRFRSVDREGERRKLGLSGRDFVVLFVGSGWERKGLKYVASAFSAFRQQAMREGIGARLWVVGKGRARRYRGPGIEFLGMRSDVERWYAAADLLLCLPIYEPSANVCAEALAAGLPVITCATNGASDLVEAGVTGEVAEAPDDLARIVDGMVGWMKQARARVSSRWDLSLERNVRETLDVLEMAAKEPRS